MSGGDVGAKNAALSIMVGGDAAALVAEPRLEQLMAGVSLRQHAPALAGAAAVVPIG